MRLELLKVGHCSHPEAVVVRGGTWRARSFPAIVGILHHPQQGYILFDTGYARRFHEATHAFPERLYRWLTPMHLPQTEELPYLLAQRGLTTEDIQYIFISHFHADHIAGLLDFPKARFICSESALYAATHQQRVHGLIKGNLPALLPPDLLQRTTFIEECPTTASGLAQHAFAKGYDIFADGSCLAIALPGHAQGQFGLLCSQDDSRYFLVADACWTRASFKDGSKPLAVANIIMSSTAQYHRTIEALAQLHAMQPDLFIIPSHCQETYDEFSHAQKI
ncbi:MAG: MBL fold metallo-hydrolase [Candidatus Electrothrix aestuarii]|uniref:MBL fold metallo-hydrolase n=1 Tax=Candidatus Electrothrix aestuarii TaxID=3062594 RepID=A0AAU8LYJ0_9BACT|nr:MBL fold metallo-hydrolase [Candidatus Electrothrix aestuarii]